MNDKNSWNNEPADTNKPVDASQKGTENGVTSELPAQQQEHAADSVRNWRTADTADIAEPTESLDNAWNTNASQAQSTQELGEPQAGNAAFPPQDVEPTTAFDAEATAFESWNEPAAQASESSWRGQHQPAQAFPSMPQDAGNNGYSSYGDFSQAPQTPGYAYQQQPPQSTFYATAAQSQPVQAHARSRIGLYVLISLLVAALIAAATVMVLRYTGDNRSDSAAEAANIAESSSEEPSSSEVSTAVEVITETETVTEPPNSLEEQSPSQKVGDDSRLTTSGWVPEPFTHCNSSDELVFASTNGNDFAVVCQHSDGFYYRGKYNGDTFESSAQRLGNDSFNVDADPYTIEIRGPILYVRDENGVIVEEGDLYDTYVLVGCGTSC
ncbi:MAG: hypothetical protein Q3976_04185 [Corynebacterium sp.]|nr:hypothetical protein [Corynebacterium sp.]